MSYLFWGVYQRLTRTVSQIPPLRIKAGHAGSDRDKAEAFALTFSAVYAGVSVIGSPFAAEVGDCITQIDSKPNSCPWADFFITVEIISTAITRLRHKGAPAFDKVTLLMFKATSVKVRLQLYYSFRYSIFLAYFRECWKVARTSPLPTPGKHRQEVTGYILSAYSRW